MNIKDYRKRAIKVIKDYLEGIISNEEASDWALDMIKSCNLKELPKDLASSIHLLFELHDAGEFWCPNREELEKSKAELERML